jgi:hypothetical protein
MLVDECPIIIAIHSTMMANIFTNWRFLKENLSENPTKPIAIDDNKNILRNADI